MYAGTLSGWLFFCVFLFWRFSDSQQKLSLHVFVRHLQVAKTTICLFRGIFWRFSFFIFLEGIFSCFLKSFDLWEVLLTKLYLTYPDEQFDYFCQNFPFFWTFRIRPKRSHTFGPEIHRFSKLQTTCVEEVLIVFFCADWSFRFSKFLWFWAIFLHFGPKKIRRVVKRAHYVSGGAFQGILFQKKIFQTIQEKIQEKLGTCSQKIFVTFVKTVFYVSYGTFVWKKKILVEKVRIFQFFADFQLRINGISVEKIKPSCQNCVIGVRGDTFRLIVLLCFFILKVFRQSAKIILTSFR